MPPRPKKSPASAVLPVLDVTYATAPFSYRQVSALVTVPIPQRGIVQIDPHYQRTYTSLEWYWPTFEKPLNVRFDAMTPCTRVLLGHARINASSGSFPIDWSVPAGVAWALSIRDADADLEIQGPPVTVILRGAPRGIADPGVEVA